MESLLERLSGAFDVVLFAVNHRGGGARRRFEVRANLVPGDNYGVAQLPGLLDEVRPDVILLHRDATFPSMHRAALGAYRARRPGARVAAYCPLDWAQVPPQLAAVDLLVLYTRSAVTTAEDAFATAGVPAPPIAVIPHGVDRALFAPLVPGDFAASRLEARRRLFPDRPELERAFIVLNGNRNQRRKRVDLTMRGFALLARDRPDAWLYLHMGMLDLGWDVPSLASELEIADRLLVTTEGASRPRVPDGDLNLIYNACDVGLNTAAAEGWGLVSFEHAATGAAQVVPGRGACAELWRDHGLLVPTLPDERGREIVSVEGVAAALGRLHDEVALRGVWAERAYALARSERFGWNAIARQWEAELLRLLGGRGVAASPRSSRFATPRSVSLP
jgi:glycosyltransferase involved in cell wall biosynthesis